MKKQEIAQRCRGQRISHAELVAEAQQVLRDAGAGNHERAMFITELSKNVVGNDLPLFCQLQPKVKVRTSDAWSRAYDLAFKFIADKELGFTLETINVECGDAKEKLESAIANISHADAEIGNLLRFNRNDNEHYGFKTRVNRYTEMSSDANAGGARRNGPYQTADRRKGSTSAVTPKGNAGSTSNAKGSAKNLKQQAQLTRSAARRGIDGSVDKGSAAANRDKEKALAAARRVQQAKKLREERERTLRMRRVGKQISESTESDLPSQNLSEFELPDEDLRQVEKELTSTSD